MLEAGVAVLVLMLALIQDNALHASLAPRDDGGVYWRGGEACAPFQPHNIHSRNDIE